MNGHTPGTWSATVDADYYKVEAASGTVAGRIKIAADARLISCAPDMLDLLEAAVARVELLQQEGYSVLSAWLPIARATINRAKGK